MSTQGTDRNARGKIARTIINNVIPTILKGNSRARRGVDAVQRISDPDPLATPTPPRPNATSSSAAAPHPNPTSGEEQPLENPGSASLPPTSNPPNNHVASAEPGTGDAASLVVLMITDTLEAAAHIRSTHLTLPHRRQPRIAVLNMASPLRPGGGVLSGATSQEESLCRRTTLYPSLREEFYRLPEYGGIYSPDVLVFRLDDDMPAKGSAQKDWFFVDVITAAMHRLPEVDEAGEQQQYARQSDREAAVKKMTAVMSMAISRGVDYLVLGAWGCGAYGNPVGEIARAWKKALLGSTSRRRAALASVGAADADAGASHIWGSVKIYFAIKDAKMADSFAESFGSGMNRLE